MNANKITEVILDDLFSKRMRLFNLGWLLKRKPACYTYNLALMNERNFNFFLLFPTKKVKLTILKKE